MKVVKRRNSSPRWMADGCQDVSSVHQSTLQISPTNQKWTFAELGHRRRNRILECSGLASNIKEASRASPIFQLSDIQSYTKYSAGSEGLMILSILIAPTMPHLKIFETPHPIVANVEACLLHAHSCLQNLPSSLVYHSSLATHWLHHCTPLWSYLCLMANKRE
jgi:hypothetical protein